jgi:hypothetical protein
MGYVVNQSGGCIVGATVEVMDIVVPRGDVSEMPRYLLGQKVTQPCDSPLLGGGFWFDDVRPRP